MWNLSKPRQLWLQCDTEDTNGDNGGNFTNDIILSSFTDSKQICDVIQFINDDWRILDCCTNTSGVSPKYNSILKGQKLIAKLFQNWIFGIFQKNLIVFF